MELTKRFSAADYDAALESWQWLDFAGKEPLCASLFGDVFFRSPDGVWFLDTMEGSLTMPWTSESQLADETATDEGQDRYLLGALAVAAHRSGLVLPPEQIYVFVPPPVVGGPFAIENIMMMDFVVGAHIAGQLHDEVRNMPPGTKISGFEFDESS